MDPVLPDQSAAAPEARKRRGKRSGVAVSRGAGSPPYTRRKNGRPLGSTELELNPGLEDALIADVRDGLPYELALMRHKVAERTGRRWYAELEEFALRVDAAKAEFALDCVRSLRTMERDKNDLDFRAQMFLLSKWFPAQFGSEAQTKVSVTAVVTGIQPLSAKDIEDIREVNRLTMRN